MSAVYDLLGEVARNDDAVTCRVKWNCKLNFESIVPLHFGFFFARSRCDEKLENLFPSSTRSCRS